MERSTEVERLTMMMIRSSCIRTRVYIESIA